MLLEGRQRLQQEIDASLAAYRAHQARHREEGVPDSEDLSVQSSSSDERIALLEARNQRRDALDEALRRLDDGRYGSCENCGLPIPEARLRALPFARLCVHCQEQEELLDRIQRREDRDDS